MNSTEIFNIIEVIANTSGKNDKIGLIDQHTGDSDFMVTLKHALDPFITYGIRPIRNKSEWPTSGRDWDDGTWGLLGDLRHRRLTGNNAQSAVAGELAALNEESSELLWRVINKDLKAGFGEASVNKVAKGTFKTFPYMRCSLPKDTKLKAWPWAKGVVSQLKADGMFFDGNIESSFTNMTTRQGNSLPIRGFEKILEQLSWLPAGSQTHGELTVINDKGETCAREIGNGILNKVIKGGDFPEGHHPVATLWDMIPQTSVTPKGICSMPYITRLRNLKVAIGAAGMTVVELVETRVVHSLKDAYKHYVEILKLGKEGTIIKLPSMIWRDGTSKDQIKLKLEAPCELEVVGFEAGKEGAKTEATFGSLQLASSDGLLRVNCSGFSDALRLEIHENREDWLGSIVTCISNGIMRSENSEFKTHSLFLPRFEERRYDKSVADSFDHIEWQFENAISLIEAEAESE